MFESLGKNTITIILLLNVSKWLIMSLILSQLCQSFLALEGCSYYKEK